MNNFTQFLKEVEGANIAFETDANMTEVLKAVGENISVTFGRRRATWNAGTNQWDIYALIGNVEFVIGEVDTEAEAISLLTTC